jgi:hypothetical protein
MKGDTFECPPPCTKPPQWPFGHVEVVCGGGRADADTGCMQAWTIEPWRGRRNTEIGDNKGRCDGNKERNKGRDEEIKRGDIGHKTGGGGR